MSAERMVLVVGQIFQGFHLKNQQTLAVLMTALVASGKAGIASLGRAIKSRASFKHSIKRVDRFLANDNVVVSDWCKALTDTVIGPRQAVKIAIDWTKIGPWPVLVASVVIKRRGIPIYWATCDWRRLKRSQNAFEESFLVMLRDMIPHDLDAILLFDRGFRRVSLVRHLKMLGFHFVIRSCADTHIMTLSNEKIALCKLHLPCGVVKDLAAMAGRGRRDGKTGANAEALPPAHAPTGATASKLRADEHRAPNREVSTSDARCVGRS